MKKLTAMLASAFAASSMLASAAVALPSIQQATIAPTPMQSQYFRTMQAQSRYDAIHGTNADQYETRTWTDPRTGDVYTLQFKKDPMPICELLEFEDGKKTFDELPYYCVDYIYSSRTDEGALDTYFQFELCWPSYYVWNQWATYEDELDGEGNIPIEKRNYDAVEFSELLNSTEWCRKFQESQGIGGKPNADQTNYEYFTMLPNEVLGIPSMVDQVQGYTTITTSKASNVEFKGYQEEDNVVSYKQALYFTSQTGSTKTIRNEPVGAARIEGFKPRTENFEFGNVYIFNMGQGGSETYGELDPYPEEWGPLAQLYIAAGDKYIGFGFPPGTTKFSIKDIYAYLLDETPAEIADESANFFQGVIYADPSCSINAATEDPSKGEYTMAPATIVEDPAFGTYLSVKPEAHNFVGYGLGIKEVEPWSEDFGMKFYTHNFVNQMTTEEGTTNVLVLGSTDGLQAHFTDVYSNTYNISYKGKINYYYDPEDLSKVRVIESVGDYKYVSVEEIAAEKANIATEQGAILVSVENDSNVAVYSLAGVKLADSKVNAGATLRVEAAHGIYVVVVNGKSAKVAL